MIALLQRVTQASVVVDQKVKAQIGLGLLTLLGVGQDDTIQDAEWLAAKVAKLRVFEDAAGLMNKSVQDAQGDVIVVSQFTLLGDAAKGNRPSYIRAARPEVALPLYRRFVEALEECLGKRVQTGEFGVHMSVSLINDGPTTLWIDTRSSKGAALR